MLDKSGRAPPARCDAAARAGAGAGPSLDEGRDTGRLARIGRSVATRPRGSRELRYSHRAIAPRMAGRGGGGGGRHSARARARAS